MYDPQSVLGIFASTKIAKFLTSLSKNDLKTILETYYVPHLPNFDADNPACQIMDVDCSSWSHSVFSGFGAFTHISVGLESGDHDLNILSEKILEAGKGGVWFAGEHAIKVEIIEGLKFTNMATITGVYQSGERAANDVISSLVK